MEKNFTQDIHYRNLLENIIFSLTDEEKEDMKAFHNFFESVEEEFNARLEKRLHDHPLFGRSLLEMSHALQEDQRKEALRLQYDAIFNENWEPYIVDQTLQGILFAQMGVDFYVWYDMLAMIRNTIRPLLFDESGKHMQEIVEIMKGKNRLFDIRMCIIAEAYLNEKKRVIEEQKKKLVKSEESQNQAQAIAHIGNWEKDASTGKITWSDETYRILGFQPGEVEPSEELILSKIPPEDLDAVRRVIYATENELQSSSLVHRLQRSNDDLRIIRMESKPIISQEGKLEGTYGILEDITEKKLAASENDRLSNIIQKSLNEIYLFNSETHKFEYVNEGALKNLGYTLEEMLEMTPRDIIPKYTPVKFQRLVERLQKDNEQKIVFETENKRKGGSLYPVEVHLQLIREDYKKIFVAIIIDISERKKAEAIIKKSNDLLAFQNTQLIDFCNIVSHNLRSPLVNMNMLVELIEESEDDLDKQKLISKFKPIINNVNETFNELVESLQIQQDLEVKSERIIVKEYLKNVIKGFEGQIALTNAAIRYNFDQAPVVYFPPKYFSSVLHNLISNALKYRSPHRLPEIYIKTKRENGDVILSVTDNGLGIDIEKHKNELFKIRKVFHFHPDAKGFGLYITKTQVETMGGKVWVEGEPDKGCTFYVAFKDQEIEK